MIRMIPFALWLSLALTSVGCSGLTQVDVGRVLTSGRDGWQHPERVIQALGILPGDRVAEIGAGSGYWLPLLAEAVGPEGRVYAVEVEIDKVEALIEFVKRHELGNVEVILGAFDDPNLPTGRIDLAITCLTYHHIEDRVVYFGRLQDDLSPRGRVAHLDDRPDTPAPISWFQSRGHWTDPEQVRNEMIAAGYRADSKFNFLPAQSFQIFTKLEQNAARSTPSPDEASLR